MASYIQWLAPRIADLKRTFPNKVRGIRDKVANEWFTKSHPRAPDIYASLYAGAELYIEFAEAMGAINTYRADALLKTIEEGLQAAMREQMQYQQTADEVERSINLLRAAFGAGECYVWDHVTQGPPELFTFVLGWRSDNPGGDLKGCGQPIGYFNQKKGELWLEPEATFKVIQRFASSQNEPILMQKATLFQRLLDRKVLADCEIDSRSGSKRPDVKRSVGDKRPRVLVFPIRIITEGGDN